MRETYAESLVRRFKELGIPDDERQLTLIRVTGCSKQSPYNWMSGSSEPTRTNTQKIDAWFDKRLGDSNVTHIIDKPSQNSATTERITIQVHKQPDWVVTIPSGLEFTEWKRGLKIVLFNLENYREG